MDSRVEEVKEIIEEIFGDAKDVKEVCEVYGELLHCIKDQMQYVIKVLTSDE